MDNLSQQPSASSAPQARSTRIESTGRKLSVSFDPESQRYGSANHVLNAQQDLGRRRSSFAERLQAFRTAGGPNSLDAFARSWQRAVGFHQITPVRQSFMVEELDGQTPPPPPEPIITPSGETFVSSELDKSPMTQRSLLREQLAAQEESVDPHTQVFEDTPVASPRPSQDLGVDERSPLIRERPSRARVRGDSIFQIEPQLSSSLGGTYGSTWGSLASRVNEPSMRHAGRLFQQQQLEGVTEPDKEREPLLVKQIQEADGTIVNVVVGQSTLPQTVFNSINTLVGVGILAVPLAMSKAGWFTGLGFLAFAGITTSYTAKLLAKCLDKDNSVVSYGDIAYIAGKKWGRLLRLVVSFVFLLELIGACVAMVILFADAIYGLNLTMFRGVSRDMWFIIFGCFMVVTVMMPLRWLSFTSIIGILCCCLIMALVVFDGVSLDKGLGSLHEPRATFVWPTGAWSTFYAWGILMAPWGGHSVFPNIYRDMRHPYHFRRAVNITYLFTLGLVAAMVRNTRMRTFLLPILIALVTPSFPTPLLTRSDCSGCYWISYVWRIRRRRN
jgi:solute carrier family 32 (vesicular inhibitory amino acid transporter)